MWGVLDFTSSHLWVKFKKKQLMKFIDVFCSFQRIFRLFCFPQVVQKHALGEVGAWTVVWRPVVSGIFVPKIIKTVRSLLPLAAQPANSSRLVGWRLRTIYHQALSLSLARTLDLWSKGREFDSRSTRYQVVITWMGDCLRTGKPSRYITNTKVNSAFHPSRGRLIEYRAAWLLLRRGAFTCVGWQVIGLPTVWSHMAGDAP